MVADVHSVQEHTLRAIDWEAAVIAHRSIHASAFALWVALVSPALAGPQPTTNILYGFITSNRTLSFAPPGPLYDVVGDVIVQPGVTLAIEPGVTLRFASNRDTLGGGDYPTLCEIEVKGTMSADASAGDSIRFVSTSPDMGSWGLIRLWNSSSSLRKLAITSATKGMVFVGGSGPSLRHSSFSNCATAIEAGGTAGLEITDVLVSGCTYGIIFPSGTGAILRCEVFGRFGGVGTGLNLGPGVSTAPPDSTDPWPTTVAGFGTGVTLEPNSNARNLVVRDNIYGVVCSTSGSEMIQYCTAVRNSTGITTYPGDAALNCIATHSDGYGFFTYGFVDYSDSWMNAFNFYCAYSGSCGLNNVAYNPFYLDYVSNDFRLAPGSIFKTFSTSGGEIGAWGPGGGLPTPARRVTWGSLKTQYR